MTVEELPGEAGGSQGQVRLAAGEEPRAVASLMSAEAVAGSNAD